MPLVQYLLYILDEDSYIQLEAISGVDEIIPALVSSLSFANKSKAAISMLAFLN
jgi:hypothetical protein